MAKGKLLSATREYAGGGRRAGRNLVSEGTYQYFNDDANTGHETWQLSQLGHGGLVITSRGEFESPAPYNWQLTFELSRGWSPVSLDIRLARGEEIFTTGQRADKDEWRARVEQPGGTVANYQVAFSHEHAVDFGSPVFMMATLLRAAPAPGQARIVNVVQVEKPSLAVTLTREQYQASAEERITVPAGDFPAVRYEITQPDKTDAPARQLWADHHGVILRVQSGAVEIRLVRYRRTETR